MTELAKLTRNQDLVLTCLQKTGTPMSAYDILGKLKPDGIKAPLQVYRALDKLVAAGLAHRLESLNAFVACAGHECHRRGLIAFAICSDCGSVEEFSDKVLGDRLDGWAEQAGFHSRSATVELRGTCASCATTH
ncbi:MAG: transcriptional repressor [Hyphomicrobiaceae bacterium]|nr:transcriptional repressor [Hyphomicrobiaceae bacterium]MCC0022736.1 transcriptional repressor [Hyphomicrobiaceae bacterium]